MKNFKTLLSITFIATILFLTSCSKDDDVNQISVQDLVVTIDENPTNGQVVGTVITDGTGASGFSITSQTPSGALSINSSTGQLTVADATLFDFETNPVITATISVVDAVNTGTVTVNLTNAGELSVADLTINFDENPTNGQTVDTVTTSNGNGTLSFSITSQTPAGALNIDPSTGELTVADATLFDFETNPVVTAAISVTDAINTATGTVTINLNDVAELTVTDLTMDFDENPTNGQTVDIVTTSNGSGTLSFSITSQTPAGALNIDPTTGELTVSDATLFDFETNPVITANISVIDAINTVAGIATINLNNINEVGDFNHGGVVFWVSPTDNAQGMVCAVSNQSFGAPFGCQGTVTGATGVSIGTGAGNTTAIESVCTAAGTAADLAANLSLNGYDDWFLPSQSELVEMYANIAIVNATAVANGGAIPNQFHWTSTEHNSSSANHAVVVNLTTGVWANSTKGFNHGVRSVRAF